MAEYSAVYYPHTTIRSEDLMRTALLLWDYVDCIVPYRGLSISNHEDRVVAEAAELLLRPRVPTTADKSKVHALVQQTFEQGIPQWVSAQLNDDYEGRSWRHEDRQYLIYPEKLLPDTWKELSRYAMARWVPRQSDYGVPSALGLILMATLASSCAGSQQHRVTDRSHAYGSVLAMMGGSLGATTVDAHTGSTITPDIERLVTVSLCVANVDKIPLKRLVELRKREERSGPSGLRSLRHNYLDAVRIHLRQLSTAASGNDASELVRQFKNQMERDLADLKSELGMARNDLLLSKEVGVMLLAAAGAVVAPATTPALATALKTVGVGACLNTAVKFKRARAKAHMSHPMSWLHVAKRSRPLI